MAEPSTIDIQKVYNSATEKFKSFFDGADAVGSADVQKIQQNLLRLFDNFTEGVLTSQGANSSYVLTTVYRGLGSAFLRILKDSSAVDRIADLIKQHQNQAKTDKNAPVSGTTRKIADGVVNADSHNRTEIIMDFLSELQQDVLQARLNLNREYEKAKLKRARSQRGQKQDIDALTRQLVDQSESAQQQMDQLDAEGETWLKESLSEIDGLVQLFNDITPEQLKKDIGNYNPEKIIREINSTSAVHGSGNGSDASTSGRIDAARLNSLDKSFRSLDSSLKEIESGYVKREKVLNEKEIDLQKREIDLQKREAQLKASQAQQTAAGSQPQQQKNTRLVQQTNISPLPPQTDSDDTRLTRDGVAQTLSTFAKNISHMLKDEKFTGQFRLHYLEIQKQMHSRLDASQKKEVGIQKNLKAVEDNVDRIQKGRRKNFILQLMSGGRIVSTLFTVLGAVLLIGFTRMMVKKWSDAYMPRTDARKDTILGVRIPGMKQIRSIIVGLRNFFTVGLPSMWMKVKGFFGRVSKLLTGRNSPLGSRRRLMDTLGRIVDAWIIGIAKKAAGAVADAILAVMNIFFPGAGTATKLIITIVPSLLSFILTQIMLIKRDSDLDSDMKVDAAMRAQQQTASQMVNRIKTQLFSYGRHVTPIVPSESIPGMESLERLKSGRRSSAKDVLKGKAIMRSVPRRHRYMAKDAKQLQERSYVKNDFAKQAKSAISSAKKGTFLANLVELASKVKHEIRSNTTVVPGGSSTSSYHWSDAENYREQFLALASTYISNLDQYMDWIHQVRQKRYLNTRPTPLYDVETGWNPVYRITADDLKTSLPFNPLEEMHQKEDIAFGTPVGPEIESKGYMPFTWIQNGARVSIDPWAFKWWRAWAIRKNILSRLVGMAAQGKDEMFEDIFKRWNMYGLATQLDYGKEREYVVFGDRFSKFLNEMRQGNVSERDNNLQSIEQFHDKQGKNFSGKMQRLHRKNKVIESHWYDWSTWGKESEEDKENYRITGAYGYGMDKDRAMALMNQLRSINVGSGKFNYGLVRDLMHHSDILDVVNQISILSPISIANDFLQVMMDKGIMPAYAKFSGGGGEEEGGKYTPIQHLIAMFLSSRQFTSDYTRAAKDRTVQQAFSQLLLMYMQSRVLPRWNAVDQGIYGFFRDPEGKIADITALIAELNRLLLPDSIYGFIMEHVRFPNAKFNVIDYTEEILSKNTPENRQKMLFLNAARTSAGIPTYNEKRLHLTRIRRMWNKWSSLSDSQLDKEIDVFQKRLKGAAYEAKWTNDHTYEAAVKDYLFQLISERDRRRGTSEATSIAPSVSLPSLKPPKSMDEMEEEERRKQQALLDKEREEAYREQMEEKRRFAEKVEERRQKAIAEAKQKEIEAIREQERRYEQILERMIGDPAKVAESELKQLGDDVANLKQEAENRIAQLPREQREMKLALIRGDKISAKTFKEMKDTAVGLHGNLQTYMEEVKKIPAGSILSINSQSSSAQPVYMQDSDAVDLAS